MFKKLNNIGDCGIACDFGEEVNRDNKHQVLLNYLISCRKQDSFKRQFRMEY